MWANILQEIIGGNRQNVRNSRNFYEILGVMKIFRSFEEILRVLATLLNNTDAPKNLRECCCLDKIF